MRREKGTIHLVTQVNWIHPLMSYSLCVSSRLSTRVCVCACQKLLTRVLCYFNFDLNDLHFLLFAQWTTSFYGLCESIVWVERRALPPSLSLSLSCCSSHELVSVQWRVPCAAEASHLSALKNCPVWLRGLTTCWEGLFSAFNSIKQMCNDWCYCLALSTSVHLRGEKVFHEHLLKSLARDTWSSERTASLCPIRGEASGRG